MVIKSAVALISDNIICIGGCQGKNRQGKIDLLTACGKIVDNRRGPIGGGLP
jgi:hypothetical protein